MAQSHILPRYKRLQTNAAQFEDAIVKLCNAAAPRDPSASQAAFHQLMDGWMAIEHIRHGPVELLMRNFRIHFWPDKGARGARQIRLLHQRRDQSGLKKDAFTSASVAVQGLPAAERLLFSKSYSKTIIDAKEKNYTCQLLQAIAQNINDISKELLASWSPGSNSYQAVIQNAGKPGNKFSKPKDATADYVKAMHTTLKVLTDLKLDRVLGKTIEKVKPKRAESWRSKRSLRNIIFNLKALQAMYEGEKGLGLKHLIESKHPDLSRLLSRAFKKTLETAQSIQQPLTDAVTMPKPRSKVLRLAKEMRALKVLVSGKLAPAIGTPLGFNALDGD